MNIVVDYLNRRYNELEMQRNDKETLMNSKMIEANEIHKTVSKLTHNDNDTYNVFSANGNRMEFHNREIIELKAQEDLLRSEADDLLYEIKEINSKIEEIAIVIAHANEAEKKITTMSDEIIYLNGEVAMYSTGGKKAGSKKKPENIKEPQKEEEEKPILSSNVESLDINMDSNKFLEEISDRIYFVSRILKLDYVRTKLELDEIYKSIIKFINK